ncbi:MAG TPA: MarR family transcriptional regulator [bacterium]|nr:MarR family transcriptional regulator [bacterium]
MTTTKTTAMEIADALRTIYRKLDLLHDLAAEITPKELALLLVLDENGPTRVKDLADKVRLPLSTVSWTADRLVTRKILSRKNDPHDRRVILLTLTRNGRKVLAKHNAIFDLIAQTAVSAIDEAETELLRRAMLKLLNVF